MAAVEINHEVDEAFDNVEQVILQIRPKWNWKDVKVESLTKGITNIIKGFRLKDDGECTDMILIRRYGEKTELIIDRKAEQRNMALLHSCGSGAPLYAILNNALVYGFMQGSTLDEDTVRSPKIRVLVAKEMAKMHSIDLSKKEGFDTSKPFLFTKIQQFLDEIPDKFTAEDKQSRWLKEGHTRESLTKEVELMERLITKHARSPLGFCHNDLLLANIVYNKEKDTVYFIDYEYGEYSYCYFDVANHFNEYAGVETVDYSRFPDKNYQKEWLSEYLKAKGGELSSPTDDQLEAVYAEVNLFCLCSNLFWSLWAFIQAENSLIDFDYMDYGIIRYNEYSRRKDEITAMFVENNNERHSSI